MFIKRLKPGIYDVFIGRGWTQWARVQRQNGDFIQVEGNFRLDNRSFNQLKVRIK